MRDRLIEILKEAPRLDVLYGQDEEWGSAADFLLANGVIVPPCKVGDTVWYELYGQIEYAVIYHCAGNLTPNGFVICDAVAKSSGGVEVTFTGRNIGKTVFLTREEADKALQEGKK